ncbi:hypothetical protein NFI96_006980 [Prochilodus magdalenae]|nr:hypothetical protein NFI96_006980 [Prochilodus magdalenae]
MFYTFLLVLTTAATCVKCDIGLIQPTSVVRKPGESLTISCTVSGYSVADDSYGTGWVRQPAGKTLEWINYMYGGGEILQKDSLKSQFSISKDASSSTVTLQGQSMQPEATAVYYCVRRQPHSSSTNTMLLTSVLLLLMAGCVHSQVVLTQSEGSVTVAPGGSHKLTCACSGLNLGDSWMAWVRQAPGKGLEWIVYYHSDSDKSTAQTVQGRFTASKDSSNFYLHMSQLKPEDTAVYYCARDSQWNSVSLLSCGEQRGSHRSNFYTNHVLYISTTPAGSCFLSSSTNTMLLTSVLLLLMAGCVHSQVVLTQSEGSVTVAPGGSYKLTCVCSGFSLSGSWMSWVRQAPGKGLEWIMYYATESSKNSIQSVQGRFTASKDSSNFYLHMSQLKPEDTAVPPRLSIKNNDTYNYINKLMKEPSTNVGVHCYKLTQPASMVVRPDQTLTIDCKVSYSVTNIISAEIRLDQSPAEVKKPGEAVKISCTISGYSMTGYNMFWIRQKPGNALEWMGRMNTGRNSATYADSMRDHFVMTEDVSTSTQFLQAKSLRAEDTAVYYCARYRTVMELMEQLY